MEMRKIFVVVFIFLATTIFAKHSDVFILGDYSDTVKDTDNGVILDTSVLELMENANFNYMRQGITDRHSAIGISNLINEFDQHGMDIRFRDIAWDDHQGTQYLTRANNWTFEAEYTETSHVGLFTNLDYWFYAIKQENSTNIIPQQDGDIYALKCAPIDGLTIRNAIENLTRRQGNGGSNYSILQIINYNWDVNPILKFKIRMKYLDMDGANSAPVCDFGLKIYINDIDANSFQTESEIIIDESSNDYSGIPLITGDYLVLNDDEFNGTYQDFIYEINLNEVTSDYLETVHSESNKKVSKNGRRVRYIFPVIKYYDRGELFIDNITITDDLYEDIDAGLLDTAIMNRVNEMNNTTDNLLALYAEDEPTPPQFDSYNEIENRMQIVDNDIRLETAVGANWYDESANNQYMNTRLFNIEANPEIITTDAYIYHNNTTVWNDPGTNYNSNSELVQNIQRRISRLCKYYRDFQTDNGFEDKEKIAIVHAFGDWKPNENTWASIMLPPRLQQKALMYLPLCYDFDGIMTFAMKTRHPGRSENCYEGITAEQEYLLRQRGETFVVGPIQDFDTPIYDWETTSQYDAIKEANEKILVYGDLIKNDNLNWLGSGTIEVSCGSPIGQYYDEFDIPVNNLSSVAIDNDGGEYYGFVECGVYEGNGSNYLMLVNRRTNYSPNPDIDPPQNIGLEVDDWFSEASSQILTFTFQEDNLALIDVYDNEFYLPESDNPNIVNVEIQPGDGMLLKVSRIVPDYINTNMIVNNAGIPRNTVIADGGCLTLTGNSVLAKNKDITVESGGILIIQDDCSFSYNSELQIEAGGHVFIHDGKTNLFNCSFINVVGQLDITNQTFSAANNYIWDGISCQSGSVLNVDNSVIKDANFAITDHRADTGGAGNITISNSTFENNWISIGISKGSTLEVDSCILNIRDTETGIDIVNNEDGVSNVLITGSEQNPTKINGLSDRSGSGIAIFSSNEELGKSVIFENISFNGLHFGINHWVFNVNTVERITNCDFVDNNFGINIAGNGKINMIEESNFNGCNVGLNLFDSGIVGSINNCNFLDNVTGISRGYSIAVVEDCLFDSNDIGIDIGECSRYVIENGNIPSFRKDVNNCSFINGDKGIRIMNSSPRIAESEFYTTIGISSGDNSFANCSYNANNLFNSIYHLAFIEEIHTFSAGAMIEKGHNDFYDSNFDMIFNTYYTGESITINCNGNWWGEDFPAEHTDDWAEYITVYYNQVDSLNIIADYNSMDISPNVWNTGGILSRIDNAFSEEENENYSEALSLFKTILTDQLYPEKKEWNVCINEVYEISVLLKEDLTLLVAFYENLINTVPSFLTEEESNAYVKILNDYIKKCYIKQKNYQNAAEIMVYRIENPISSIDSLYAVMELENLYSLSSIYEDRQAVIHTSMDHLAPADLHELSARRAKHWNEIEKLFGFNELIEGEFEHVPDIPILCNNYPNPFNPSTTIGFSIPNESKIKISVYNIKGQRVKNLINEKCNRGNHKVIWDGKDSNNKSVVSGVYFYKLDVNGKTEAIKKCLLLK